MQDALFEIGVAPSSTLSFIGSTQVSLFLPGALIYPRSLSRSHRRKLGSSAADDLLDPKQATLEALFAIPISRLVAAYGNVRLHSFRLWLDPAELLRPPILTRFPLCVSAESPS